MNLLAGELSLGAELVIGDRFGECFHETSGHARKNPLVPWPRNALVDLASVTKAVATSLALGLCVEQGQVSLTGELGTYLDIQHAGSRCRIMDLASHVSGYSNQKLFCVESRRSGMPIVQSVLAETPVRPAGEMFEYACINFILLGLVVEAVSGMNLAAYCHQYLYAPLGLHDTRFGPIADHGGRVVSMLDNVAPGTIHDHVARDAGCPLGNAGLFSTAHDLGRICRMLIGGGTLDGVHVMASETVALFEHNLNPPGLRRRSLGWDVDETQRPAGLSPQAFGHTGWTGQTLYADRGSGLYAIFLGNRRGDHQESIRYRKTILGEAVHQVRSRCR